MPHRYHLLGAVLGALLVQGCAKHAPARPPADRHDNAPSHDLQGPQGAGVPSASASSARHANPPGVLTLREALAATLTGSPELQAYSWSVRAADAEVLQAGARPNPELSVNPENFVGSGVFADQVQFQNTVQLSQLIELGGKREHREGAAAAARDKTTAEYDAKRVEVLGGTTLDFIEVLGDQERLKLAGLTVRHAQESLRAAERRVSAGVGSKLEVTRAKVLVARADIAREHVEHELKSSRRNLAARWAGRDVFTEVTGELFAPHEVPSLEQLEARLSSSPERKLAVAEGRLRAAEVALARTRQTSDVTLSAAWRHGRTSDDQTAVLGFSVPLQVFNRYEGEIAAAEATEQAARFRGQAVETRLRAVLFGLYQELLHARTELEAMRTEIVPRSEEGLSLARKGFDDGLFTQLEFLDAQRTLVEVRQEYIEAASTFHRLVAEVERLLGEAL